MKIMLHTETVRIADLRRNPELQCRAKGTHRATAEEYAEAMKAGAAFPPIVVYRDADGVHWLSDGFHRAAAAELAGIAELPAEIREGGEAEALLYAASANAEHGRPRTTDDKRRAVLALHSHPQWSKRAARWIAEQCKVSPTFAADVLRTVHGGQLPETEGKDGKKRKAPKAKKAPKVNLARVYASTLRTHKAVSPREHVQALVIAVIAFDPKASPTEIAGWIRTEPASAELAPPRRRIVQPKGAAATNGGES